jgi:GH24 family phage-related lysozyme (muramidase)
MTSWNPEKLRDFFYYYDRNNPDHRAAVDLLQNTVSEVMNDDADWVKVYRGEPGSTNCLERAVEIISEFEGFEPLPYLCPAGVWTIGFGTTYYPDGSKVSEEDPEISRAKASEFLEDHISKHINPRLSQTVPTWGILNSNQKAALISFAYNLGANFYGNSGFYTISKALSTPGWLQKVPSALMLYINPGSSFEAGLRRRRSAEVDLWMKTT